MPLAGYYAERHWLISACDPKAEATVTAALDIYLRMKYLGLKILLKEGEDEQAQI
jgi:hypothetical protein